MVAWLRLRALVARQRAYPASSGSRCRTRSSANARTSSSTNGKRKRAAPRETSVAIVSPQVTPTAPPRAMPRPVRTLTVTGPAYAGKTRTDRASWSRQPRATARNKRSRALGRCRGDRRRRAAGRRARRERRATPTAYYSSSIRTCGLLKSRPSGALNRQRQGALRRLEQGGPIQRGRSRRNPGIDPRKNAGRLCARSRRVGCRCADAGRSRDRRCAGRDTGRTAPAVSDVAALTKLLNRAFRPAPGERCNLQSS